MLGNVRHVERSQPYTVSLACTLRMEEVLALAEPSERILPAIIGREHELAEAQHARDPRRGRRGARLAAVSVGMVVLLVDQELVKASMEKGSRLWEAVWYPQWWT